MANNKKRSSRDIASDYIVSHEGDEASVYDDSAGKKTIGKGLNLEAPLTQLAFKRLGLDPQKMMSGEEIATPEQLEQAYQFMMDKTEEGVDSKFRDLNLNDNEKAALMSLYYNSPSLIGDNLTNYINNNDKNEAMKEIMLRTNRTKNYGVAKRRLNEAKLFGGEEGLNKAVNTMTPEELIDLRHTFDAMPDTAEKRALFNNYKFLNPDTSKDPFPFMKLKKGLYSPLKDQYEASKNPIQADFLPVSEINQTDFQAPSDNFIPKTEDTNPLDKFNLLKRWKEGK